ncbi:MAG: glycosyltransferase [Thermogemmatispora sp.]|uniref:glycosyltransferase n=1 Tax=Thermogemmatispora sp. TaxID=1968838 RepID=UPI001A099E35|nr:glycosyltransferase [Thermogemmatispora sp.]MBE3567120.1 glycosyltransferase [Thermogemmatispora sp.]
MRHAIAMLCVHTSPLDMPGQTPDAGGMNVYIRSLARELGQRQVAVDIFTRRTEDHLPPIVPLGPRTRVIQVEAGPVARLPKHDLYPYLPQFCAAVEAFRQAEGLSYDLIHSHYWLSACAGLELASRWHVAHVTMFHTLAQVKLLSDPTSQEPPLRTEMEKQVVAEADRIIAATAEERLQLMNLYAASPGRISVIPCGVDLRHFVPQDRFQARQRYRLPLDRPLLLFAGRLDPFKGPDLVLRALALMEEQAEAVIVGGKLRGDRELQQLRRLAASLGMTARVHFLGALPPCEMPFVYSAADVTVVPSYNESFGLAAVESLACGTPVVATRVGGLAAIVRHGETGYLVPRCAGFFAERLDFMLRHPLLLAQMRRAARPSVMRFNWQQIASQVLDVYAELLSDARYLLAQ